LQEFERSIGGCESERNGIEEQGKRLQRFTRTIPTKEKKLRKGGLKDELRKLDEELSKASQTRTKKKSCRGEYAYQYTYGNSQKTT